MSTTEQAARTELIERAAKFWKAVMPPELARVVRKLTFKDCRDADRVVERALADFAISERQAQAEEDAKVLCLNCRNEVALEILMDGFHWHRVKSGWKICAAAAIRQKAKSLAPSVPAQTNKEE